MCDVEIACPPAGATPKQPSMGANGRISRPSRVSGATSVAVPAATSTSHSANGRWPFASRGSSGT